MTYFHAIQNNGLKVEVVRSGSIRCIERALPIRSSFSGMAISTSMTAVTVACDEKSVVDKAAAGAHFSPAAQSEAERCRRFLGPFSKSARRGAPPVIWFNVKRQTRVLLTG
jgi:hypothetical protein